MEGPDASPTSVLIAGPPETGQAELAFDALSRSSTVVAVAPSDAAAAVESWYEGRAAALRTVDPTDGTGEPLSLSAIGVATLEAVADADEPSAWVALDAVPGAVPDGDLEPVFRFFHLLCHRLERDGGRLVCTADATRFGEAELRTLGELFDRRRSTRADAPVAGLGR